MSIARAAAPVNFHCSCHRHCNTQRPTDGFDVKVQLRSVPAAPIALLCRCCAAVQAHAQLSITEGDID